ncbi:fibrobacter succinogenes major paralogous domain-containing protein [Elizabethkingia miricola]|uniref:FISUMP domain-containing protein n=2 Tax=Bacteria TaxID=2 RepID=A0ABD5B3T0_ELIMR|nr:FISUMP domain-containing protein [Elizabethkingia miricola]MDQ8748592.1 FISUMP domain-containing protein [Elizabethkingia miricola]OPB88217.1 hypothetical protein BAS06_13680 [Elizabethkingia miricola]PSL86738.1 hypothetical protein C7V10_19030 [Elizabethkingia miricola]QHQ85846.1 hypothetical protein FE632_03170 [Elizabethkingia miricola]UIO97090.1 fibrobacter succinogenes major paralogous domain-containing protein [Elizabethkingia miricola]
MKNKLYIIKGASILFSVFFLNSCRSTDADDVLTSGGALAINMNLLGADYSNSTTALTASLNKNSSSVSEVQSHGVLIDPSTFMGVKLSPSTEGGRTIANASSGAKSTAVVSGNSLGAGVKFRIIAYRQSNGAYHTYQDYTVGVTAVPMMLDNGVPYDIVVYSYGTASLPVISSGEQSNINSATVNYSDVNRDFMYQKIAFTPTNATNTLNITLRHKVAQITTILNSVNNSGNITAINSGILTSHYTNGVYSLSSGTMSGRTTVSSGVALNFPSSGFPGATQISTPVFINNDTGGNASGGFSANITVGGITKTFNLPNSFKITPENKSNLTINLSKCGAYLGPGNTQWKDFMCHNLGADRNADPFIPAAAIHGAKYQWGGGTGEAGKYYSQANDQSNSGAILGWNNALIPDDAWSAGKDPCPTGYRIPTKEQWESVVNNNVLSTIGTNWTESVTNFDNVVKFGDYLFLPAAGFRLYSNGALTSRGNISVYWSSSIGGNAATAYLMSVFGGADATVTTTERRYGMSVRCIAE